MNIKRTFDVLVVYTDAIAQSASSNDENITVPFQGDSEISDYNDAYAYFLNECKKNNLKAAFTTTKDLLSDKTFKSFWTFERNNWKKNKVLCSAPIIFDKFSPVNLIQKNRRLSLFANRDVVPFNDPGLHALFFDKQKTYDLLEKFAIPTVTVDGKDRRSIATSVNKLQLIIDNHPKKSDFSRRIVIKDRFGAGGNKIFRTELGGRKKTIFSILAAQKKSSFVLQPFTMFKQGQAFSDKSGFVDIRIIYMGKKIIQTFTRTSAADDFRCNMSKGGNVEYIDEIKIPKGVAEIANQILKVLDSNGSLFTLDFIVSNRGNTYLMEGNCGPGLNWSKTNSSDKTNTKKLIRSIVGEIVRKTLVKPRLRIADGLLPSQLNLAS